MDGNFSQELQRFLKGVKRRGKRVLLITDENLASIYSVLLKKMAFETIVLEASELVKSRKVKAFIEDELFIRGYTKNTELIALGGGVVLDLVGFIAATFMRGVTLSFIPTTITAFCDASIGGKNGINTDYGKNLIGSFYEPIDVCLEEKCFIDFR